MALRIRDDGRILCAATHPEKAGDTYLHDGISYRLTVDLRAIVTEPMESADGRGGHGKHGEWWWANAVPDDVTLESVPNKTLRCGRQGRYFGLDLALDLYARLHVKGNSIGLKRFAEERGASERTVRRIVDVLSMFVPLVDETRPAEHTGGLRYIKLMEERPRVAEPSEEAKDR